MNKKKDIQKFYTQEEFEERQRNWKPHLGLNFLWTWWDVKDFFAELSYYLRKLLRIIESKLKRNGYPDIVYLGCDSWSLDYRIAELIIYGTKTLRERAIGNPANLSSMEEWHEILLAIQQGFEESIKLKDSEYEFGSDKEKVAQEKFEKGFDLFREYFYDLWD